MNDSYWLCLSYCLSHAFGYATFATFDLFLFAPHGLFGSGS